MRDLKSPLGRSNGGPHCGPAGAEAAAACGEGLRSQASPGEERAAAAVPRTLGLSACPSMLPHRPSALSESIHRPWGQQLCKRSVLDQNPCLVNPVWPSNPRVPGTTALLGPLRCCRPPGRPTRRHSRARPERCRDHGQRCPGHNLPTAPGLTARVPFAEEETELNTKGPS